MALEEHQTLVFGMLSFIGIVGSIISVTFGRLISGLRADMKTKVPQIHCDDLHKAIDNKLATIEKVTEKTSDKMDDMSKTLVRIETILKVGNQQATERYERHTEKFKDE